MTVNVQQEPKGSSVEYLKDRLVEVFTDYIRGNCSYLSWARVSSAHKAYVAALSASPDFEGEWHWVPKEFVVWPKDLTPEMINIGVREAGMYISDYSKIQNAHQGMLAARPPVPKKGERS